MVRKLLYLNGLAILGVILFHSAGTGFIAMFAWSHRFLPEGVSAASQIGSSSYYALRFIEQLVVYSLPAFLFVSGYFVSVQAGRSGNMRWSAVWGRVKGLLIPYLIWSLVVIFLEVLQGARYGPIELVVMLLTGSTSPILYFVPLLIQFYILAPFFVNAARKNWQALLIITAALQALIIAAQHPQFLGIETSWDQTILALVPKWLFLARIFWFPLGIVVGFHADKVGNTLPKIKHWLILTAVIMIPLGMMEWELFFSLSSEAWLAHRETFLDSFYALAVIFGVLSLQTKSLPYFSQMGSLGAKSYGIYLTHALFITYTARIIYAVAPQLLGYQIIIQPLLILVGLGGPLLMMEIANRIPFRRSYVYLFG